MPNHSRRRNPEDADLIAFAEAVGNYTDVAAEAAGERDAYAPATGDVFDFEASEPSSHPGPGAVTAAREIEPSEPIDAEPRLAEAIVPLLGMRMAAAEIDLGYARLIQAGELSDAPDE